MCLGPFWQSTSQPELSLDRLELSEVGRQRERGGGKVQREGIKEIETVCVESSHVK